MRCKCGLEVADREILAEAGRIRERMRKVRRGTPPKPRRCWRCGEIFMGQALLIAHLALCPLPPPQPVFAEDLIPWEPDAA